VPAEDSVWASGLDFQGGGASEAQRHQVGPEVRAATIGIDIDVVDHWDLSVPGLSTESRSAVRCARTLSGAALVYSQG